MAEQQRGVWPERRRLGALGAAAAHDAGVDLVRVVVKAHDPVAVDALQVVRDFARLGQRHAVVGEGRGGRGTAAHGLGRDGVVHVKRRGLHAMGGWYPRSCISSLPMW